MFLGVFRNFGNVSELFKGYHDEHVSGFREVLEVFIGVAEVFRGFI